jgi:hypothetical protein
MSFTNAVLSVALFALPDDPPVAPDESSSDVPPHALARSASARKSANTTDLRARRRVVRDDTKLPPCKRFGCCSIGGLGIE